MTHQRLGGLLANAAAARSRRSERPGAVHEPDEAAAELVDEALASSSQPLTPDEKHAMGRRLGHDFDQVRIHSGQAARDAARELDAAAFAVGRHVVLGDAADSLRTAERDALLAHELGHVVQQRFAAVDTEIEISIAGDDWLEHEADAAAASNGEAIAGSPRARTAGPVVQRFELWRNIVGLFAGEEFSEAELHDYLKVIRDSGKPEDITDSDNKARAIVRAWRQGNSPYVITPKLMTTMIKEMQLDATLDDDEEMILELLERAENHHLGEVFGPGGVNVGDLVDDFHGEEEDRLLDFFGRRFAGGLEALRAGTVKPKGRAVPLGAALGTKPRATHPGDEVPEPVCSVKTPEHCHSYESWIRLFSDVPAGKGVGGRRVIGIPEPKKGEKKKRKLNWKSRPTRKFGTPFTKEDRFIDGPTDKWVTDNLPPHLAEVAYRLPTDCADIGVVLRHVWLTSHGRTEMHGEWLVGAALHEPRSREIQKLLLNEVWSGSIEQVVQAYRGDDGKPLRSFEALQSLLKPGDMLVWDHTAGRGGHVHTIMGIKRNGAGNVTQLDLLQGNQPIGEKKAKAIVKANPKLGLSVKRLRAAPGRRIERSELAGDQLRDNHKGIWWWNDADETELVVAGPPVAAGRPAARKKRKGSDVVRGLEDWVPEMRTAKSTHELQSRFEAAVLETRARVEHGKPAGADVAAAFGQAAGEQLWKLAASSARQPPKPARKKRSKKRPRDAELLAEDLAASSHYWPLHHMIKMLDALAGESRNKKATAALFAAISGSLNRAARGATTIDFGRTVAQGAEVANVLVAGFDPFAITWRTKADKTKESVQVQPERGRVNPSGAAALQLDGTKLSVDADKVAAIEGVIMPVSYGQFRSGLVESTLAPHSKDLDVVVTVSMDPNLSPGTLGRSGAAPDALRLERFATGVHELKYDTSAHRLSENRLEAIPGLPGSGVLGPGIIEARGAEGMGKAAHLRTPEDQAAGKGKAELVERREITFRFPSAAEADRAMTALGLAPPGKADVVIEDQAALQSIVATMERGIGGVGITFRVGAMTFQAKILEGPGGDFLSNEVSYRVLRFLAAGGGRKGAASFHIHTQRATKDASGKLPQEVGTKEQRSERRSALDLARRVVRLLVANLRKLIKAAAGAVLTNR